MEAKGSTLPKEKQLEKDENRISALDHRDHAAGWLLVRANIADNSRANPHGSAARAYDYGGQTSHGHTGRAPYGHKGHSSDRHTESDADDEGLLGSAFRWRYVRGRVHLAGTAFQR
jgi:hypothetical protein